MRVTKRRLLAAATLCLSAVAATIGIPPLAAVAAVGTIKEFSIPTANSVPEDITAGPDGNLWFGELNGNRIGRITPTGTFVECGSLGSPIRQIGGITTGPDGNLWFTETTDKIGEVSPTCGLLGEFAVPANSGPNWITPGPDGNLWFTEFTAAKIAKISTAGVVTQMATLASGAGPTGISAGPDGNLWFVEQTANKIGRITTGGTVTEFPLPPGTETPAAITAGPDGNLWFTEFDANMIGRITTSGTITEFGALTAGSQPGNIAAGPDGNVWFTQEHSNQVGRITPAGVVTEFSGMTSGAGPGGITVGPDGNVWFTERLTSKIGRLSDAQAVTSYVLDLPSGFAPKSRTVPQGTNVQWIFMGPTTATSSDSSGMGLFDSGPKSFVTYFSSPFSDAGSFTYKDTLNPTHVGTIKVPITASPKTGTTSTTFVITWAAAAAPSGFVFDIQIERPGSTSFFNWTTGQTAPSATFIADSGSGTYRFRSRLHKANNTHSGYSPVATIVVS